MSLVLITLFLLVGLSDCQKDSSYFTSIYSSTYENKFDTPDSLSLFTNFRIAGLTSEIFIAAQSSGIIVIKDDKVVYAKAQIDSVENLFVTSDGQIIFFMENSKLSVYHYNKQQQVNKLALSKVFEASEDYGESVEVVFNKAETIALVATVKGYILLFDISKRSQGVISLLDTFRVDPVLSGIKLSLDSKWIILSDLTYGAMLFRWLSGDQAGGDKVPRSLQDLYLIGVCDSVSPNNSVLTSDGRYFITIQYWEGISILDLLQAQTPHIGSTKPESYLINTITAIVSNYWPRKSQPNGHALALSADERFIAIGERSVALYIIDISDRTKPQLFQTILANYFSLAASFSKDADEQYLFYSNGNSLLRFKKSTPNLNIDVPNLYNVHRSVNNVVGESKWRWIGTPDPNGEYFFSSDLTDGLYIMDMRKSHLMMEDLTHFQGEGSTVDSFLLFGKSSEYLAIPIVRKTTFIDIYDVSDRSMPVLLTSVPSLVPNYSYSMDYNEEKSLLVFDQNQSIVIVSAASLPQNIEVLKVWSFPSGYFDSILNGALFSYDCKYLILLQRDNALVLVNIVDIQNPIFQSKIHTFGGEFIAKGKYKYTQYLFLADGLSGIKIIDQTKFPLIVVVSSVEVRGYASHVTLLSSGNYALISSFDKGQISLIDLSTITSPTVISTLQYQSEISSSTSVLETFDYFYIINQSGVRSVPLFSEAYIHTDIQLVLNQQTGTPTLQSLDKSTILQVGQKINFNFLILHPVDGILITDVLFLEYYDVVDIPYWMTYNSADQTLSMTIVKDTLGLNYNSATPRIELNTIVIETKKPVLATDFIFTQSSNSVDTTTNQAQLIWNYLRTTGYLDKRSFVTNLFEYESAFSFEIDGVPSDNSQLFLLVKIVLQNSIMYNPIIFKAKASLSLQVNPQESLDFPNYFEYIETVSDYVYLYLTIDKSLGKFVSQNYAGVITSTSSSMDQIKIEGDPRNINEVLTTKVQLFLYSQQRFLQTQSSSSSSSSSLLGSIQIRLTDSINYEISQSHNFSEVSFLSYRDSIQVNPQMRLQDQFNRKFAGGIIDIKTSFDIEFSAATFISPAISTLTYSAYIIKEYNKDNKPGLHAISDNYWLQFQPNLLKFQGTAVYANYNENYCFLVEVTDTFSTASDSFCLEASGIPLILVLNLFLQYIGPVLFVLGFIRYKHKIYNIIVAHRNVHEIQYAKCNMPFKMRVLFLGQNLQIANIIFNIFLQSISEVDRKEKKRRISVPKDEELFSAKSTMTMTLSSPENQQRLEALQKDKTIPDSKKRIITQLHSMSSRVPRQATYMERAYVEKNTRALLYDKFIKDLVNQDIAFKFNGHLYKVASIKQDLLSSQHILNCCLRALLARYLLSKDCVASKAYELMRAEAIESEVGSESDRQERKNSWYTKYVSINHNDIEGKSTRKKDSQIITIDNATQELASCHSLFPQVTLKTKAIQQFLDSLALPDLLASSAARRSSTSTRLSVNYELIGEVLLADALGLIFNVRLKSLLFPSFGESLHMSEHEISSVEAFVKSDEKSYFECIRRWLNIEYVHITSHQNRKLPQWIDYKLKRNLMLIEGTPAAEEDKSEFLIRFYDQRGYIVRQFMIKIIKENSNNFTQKIDQNAAILSNLAKSNFTATIPITNSIDGNQDTMQPIQLNQFNDSMVDHSLIPPDTPLDGIIPFSTFNSNYLEGFGSPLARKLNPSN